MPVGNEYPQPYIKSGPNKGRIRDPLVAHEVYNTIENLKTRETGKRHHKVYKSPFFKRYGNDEALILQAAKNVREEQKDKIDDLTALHRQESYRPFVEEKIDELKAKETGSFGIIRFDLDYFSWINNNVEAHQFGDLYISFVGKILRDELRKSDIGIRVGGDEFVTLISNIQNEQDFKQVAERIHNALNKRVLASTLQSLLLSDRQISDTDGSQVREGTYALKQFLTGLIKLRDNVDDRETHFINTGRGEREEKGKFMELIKEADLNKYTAYLEDKRSLVELGREDIDARRSEESEIAELLEVAFFNLGVSAGGIYVTKNNLQGFFPLDKKLDEMVSAVKRKGGGKLLLEE